MSGASRIEWTEQTDAWDQGFKACQRGEESDANPYMSGTVEHSRWLAGWSDLQEHITARDAACSFLFDAMPGRV